MRNIFKRKPSGWESFYTSQDVNDQREAVFTWSVYREWFASRYDEGEPWGQEYVSTHPDEASANAEASRLYYAAHPEIA